MKFVLLSFVGIGILTGSNTKTAPFVRTQGDSIRGRLIKTITTPAQFASFDKKHSDRFFMHDASDGLLLTEIMTVPEMDCFLANHVKDDLRVTYEIHETTDSNAKIERLNYATRILSLKTGDDTRTWSAKESKDSTLMQRHHKQLKNLREEE